MNDLVKRLRESRAVWEDARGVPSELESEAAARIEALEAENARMRDALEWYEKQTRLSATSTDHQADHAEHALDCDRGARARAALAEQEKDDE